MSFENLIKESYYHTLNGMLFHGDTIEWMSKLPDKSIDCIIADLPYGTTSCKWDIIIPFDKLWEQYERIIKDDGAIVLFGTEPFSSYLRLSNIKLYKYDWKWIKDKPTNFINCKNAPMRKHENISVFSKGMTANGSKNNMKYFPQGLIEINKKVSGAKNKEGDTLGYRPSRAKHKGHIQQYTNYPTDVLEFSNKIKNRYHSTQKPVELIQYLIRTYSKENELILDNTSGSGTLAVAAELENRKWICIEKEQEYCDITIKRLQELHNNQI